MGKQELIPGDVRVLLLNNPRPVLHRVRFVFLNGNSLDGDSRELI